MMRTVKFQSINDLQQLQQLACQTAEDVFLHSLDSRTMVDAKSFIGLFTMDLSQPVNVVTESQFVLAKLNQ